MKTICTLFLIGMTWCSWSQYDMDEAKKEEDTKTYQSSWFDIRQRIYVGGEMGLSFSTGSSYIFLAPLIGYDITERFSAGISGMYQLNRFRYFTGEYFNLHAYGGGIFTRLRPIDPIIIQAEFDLFNTNDLSQPINSGSRVNVPAFMAGLGYASSLGPGAYYQILLMYDFINDPNMPLPPFFWQPLHLKIGMVWHLGN